MANTAFNARFRIMENRKRKGDRDPNENICVDFTPEEARKAAQWLMDKASETEAGSSTIRQYRGRNDYEEVPGFTLWGGIWETTGKFSPMPLEASNDDVPF